MSSKSLFGYTHECTQSRDDPQFSTLLSQHWVPGLLSHPIFRFTKESSLWYPNWISILDCRFYFWVGMTSCATCIGAPYHRKLRSDLPLCLWNRENRGAWHGLKNESRSGFDIERLFDTKVRGFSWEASIRRASGEDPTSWSKTYVLHWSWLM